MEYKSSEEKRTKALARYYLNRESILKQQKKRLQERYKTDEAFRLKRKLRDQSRMVGARMTNLSGQVCSICSSDKGLQRHHPSYDSIDYIVVCRKCHNTLHHSH